VGETADEDDETVDDTEVDEELLVGVTVE